MQCTNCVQVRLIGANLQPEPWHTRATSMRLGLSNTSNDHLEDDRLAQIHLTVVQHTERKTVGGEDISLCLHFDVT